MSRVAELRAARPRATLLQISGLVAALACVASWLSLDIGTVWSERSGRNLARFLTEIQPWPLRSGDGTVLSWVSDLLTEAGVAAIGGTLACSVLATVLAVALATFFAPLAASRPRGVPKAVRLAIRAGLLFLRAIPEYIWAFLLLTVLGLGILPAVLALALHNAGILGRLGAEVLEDAEPRAGRALQGLGAGRTQVLTLALVPQTLNRLILFVFVRWESAVREATVLGMLGFVSLGWYLQEARAAARYDELLFFVLLGSATILAGDALSVLVRHRLRQAPKKSA